MLIINSRFLTQKITGVQRYSVEISKQLSQIFPNTTFVSPQNIIQKELANQFQPEIYGSFSGHIWEQLELPKYLHKNKSPLTLNLGNTAPLFYRNKILVIHDLIYLRNPEWFSKKFTYQYKFLIPKIAKNALKVVTVSEFSKKEIIELLNIPEEKIEVAYNSVSDEFVSYIDKNYKNVYGDYILAVSSLDPRKNFKNLILAYNKLNLKDIRLLIVGAKNTKVFGDNELDNIINNNPNITFTGYVSDRELANLYKNAKIFVYTSLYEGFGIPPLEAMACGCPTVVSNISSIPEVCSDAAYYINPHDINNIARGIYEVLNDEKTQQELKLKGLERAKVYSWSKSGKKIAQVIQNYI